MTQREAIERLAKWRPYIKARVCVDKHTGCWNWTQGKHPRGYGRAYVNRRGRYAHRLAAEVFNGWDVSDMCVCHRCDNPSCVNPAHLFLGTQITNQLDKVAKGRQARGSAVGSSKLTEGQVAEILALDRSGVPSPQLARRFAVDHSTVRRIVTGKLRPHATIQSLEVDDDQG